MTPVEAMAAALAGMLNQRPRLDYTTDRREFARDLLSVLEASGYHLSMKEAAPDGRLSPELREAVEGIRSYARHDESCDFTTGLRGLIAAVPCSCGFDAAEDAYDAALAASATTTTTSGREETGR